MKKIKLNDLVTFERGITYKKSDQVEKSNNIVLRATNVNLFSNKLDLSDLRYISNKLKIDKKKIVKKEDILICISSGSKKHLGKVAYIENNLNMAFGGFMGVLRVNGKCLSKYLFYNLISDKFKIYLKQLTDGASINNLKFSQIENFEFLIPNIEKQKIVIDKIEKNEIAVDNLINNNLEKNELLKELKLQLLNELLD